MTPQYRYVSDLPDLINAEEYPDHPDGRLVRLRIRVTETGLEIVGDAFRPESVEAIMAELGAAEIQQMLCG
jgi:hypothetical protein